jgi:site-specific DNA-methyltransferase (adenine-specific)
MNFFSKTTLFNDDCFNIFPQLNDHSIDLILCDPPYQMTQNSWDTALPLDLLWTHYKRIIKENGVIALFGYGKFGASLIMSNPDMYKYDLVWNKYHVSGFLNANREPLRVHENIYIFYSNRSAKDNKDKRPTYNPQFTATTKKIHSRGEKTLGKTSETPNYGKYKFTPKRESTDKYPTSIISHISHAPNAKGHHHPTQKPVKLMEWLIKTYSNEGDLVLDNCMGSGTTGVACISNNRDFIGIEMDSKYFGIAEKRMEEAKNERGFTFIV